MPKRFHLNDHTIDIPSQTQKLVLHYVSPAILDSRSESVKRLACFSKHPKTSWVRKRFFKFNLFQFAEKFLARKPVQRLSSTLDIFA